MTTNSDFIIIKINFVFGTIIVILRYKDYGTY
jgi:hypothetical protein